MDFKRASNSTDKLEEFIAGADTQKEAPAKKSKAAIGTKFSKELAVKIRKKISDVYAGQIYRTCPNHADTAYKRRSADNDLRSGQMVQYQHERVCTV